MKRVQRCLFLAGTLVGCLGLTGCPSSTKEVRSTTGTSDSSPAAPSSPAARAPAKRRFVPLRNRLEPLPTNIETVAFKKGQDDLMLYLHPKGVLSTRPMKGSKGQWKTLLIPLKRHRTWFVKLNPEKGAKLGIYTSISLIMAIYNSPGGYAGTSRFSVRFLLRRNGEEKELFRTMLLARGQRFKYYGVDNREIASETPLQKGDVLVFRVKHRTGSNGAVGLGGVKDGELGPRFMISTRQIGNFYQYTK